MIVVGRVEEVGWTARWRVGSLKQRCINNWVELSVKADIR